MQYAWVIIRYSSESQIIVGYADTEEKIKKIWKNIVLIRVIGKIFGQRFEIGKMPVQADVLEELFEKASF